jgi:hypothetical protein
MKTRVSMLCLAFHPPPCSLHHGTTERRELSVSLMWYNIQIIKCNKRCHVMKVLQVEITPKKSIYKHPERDILRIYTFLYRSGICIEHQWTLYLISFIYVKYHITYFCMTYNNNSSHVNHMLYITYICECEHHYILKFMYGIQFSSPCSLQY